MEKESRWYHMEDSGDGNSGSAPPLPLAAADAGPAYSHTQPHHDSYVMRYYFTREEARSTVHALEEEIVFLAGLFREAGAAIPMDVRLIDSGRQYCDPQPMDDHPVAMFQADPPADGGRIG